MVWLERIRAILDTPDLPARIAELPAADLGQLVRRVGLEDAGDILSLAQTKQLVGAFDEDIFVGAAPGEAEHLDPNRLLTWLEVMGEGGMEPVADRFAEMSEDFVALALSSFIYVVETARVEQAMSERSELEGSHLDKVLEDAAAVEEFGDYQLFARGERGWSTVWAWVLALDERQPELLERVLRRCADVGADKLDDLEVLQGILSEAEVLAEEVEDQREMRRTALGYVEPREAKAFLALAAQPFPGSASALPRDEITRSHFARLEADPLPVEAVAAAPAPGIARSSTPPAGEGLVRALRTLAERNPRLAEARTEELGYLGNVLLAGATDGDGATLGSLAAADAALATVGLGAELEHRLEGGSGLATVEQLIRQLGQCPADRLFRRASAALAASGRASVLDGREALEGWLEGDAYLALLPASARAMSSMTRGASAAPA